MPTPTHTPSSPPPFTASTEDLPPDYAWLRLRADVIAHLQSTFAAAYPSHPVSALNNHLTTLESAAHTACPNPSSYIQNLSAALRDTRIPSALDPFARAPVDVPAADLAPASTNLLRFLAAPPAPAAHTTPFIARTAPTSPPPPPSQRRRLRDWDPRRAASRSALAARTSDPRHSPVDRGWDLSSQRVTFPFGVPDEMMPREAEDVWPAPPSVAHGVRVPPPGYTILARRGSSALQPASRIIDRSQSTRRSLPRSLPAALAGPWAETRAPTREPRHADYYMTHAGMPHLHRSGDDMRMNDDGDAPAPQPSLSFTAPVLTAGGESALALAPVIDLDAEDAAGEAPASAPRTRLPARMNEERRRALMEHAHTLSDRDLSRLDPADLERLSARQRRSSARMGLSLVEARRAAEEMTRATSDEQRRMAEEQVMPANEQPVRSGAHGDSHAPLPNFGRWESQRPDHLLAGPVRLVPLPGEASGATVREPGRSAPHAVESHPANDDQPSAPPGPPRPGRPHAHPINQPAPQSLDVNTHSQPLNISRLEDIVPGMVVSAEMNRRLSQVQTINDQVRTMRSRGRVMMRRGRGRHTPVPSIPRHIANSARAAPAPAPKMTIELSIPSELPDAGDSSSGATSRVMSSEKKIFNGCEWKVNAHVKDAETGSADPGPAAKRPESGSHIRVIAVFLECVGPGEGAAQGASDDSPWSAGEVNFTVAVSGGGVESEREFCHEFCGNGQASHDWGGKGFEVGVGESKIVVVAEVPKTIVSVEKTLMKIGREGAGCVCQICMDGKVDQAIVPCGHAFCEACVGKMGATCGMCRGNVESTMRIYIA